MKKLAPPWTAVLTEARGSVRWRTTNQLASTAPTGAIPEAAMLLDIDNIGGSAPDRSRPEYLPRSSGGKPVSYVKDKVPDAMHWSTRRT